MSPLWLTGLAVAAMFIAYLIHRLYRGARRQLVVASLKPFEDVNRPRLTFARVRQPLLLAIRLALFAALLAAVLIERPLQAEGGIDGDVIAVVPGTSPDAWETVGDEGVAVRWLDGTLSSTDAPPVVGPGGVGAALIRLDQLMPDAALLTVVGRLPAADWPLQMPTLSRPVRWIDAARTNAPATLVWSSELIIAGGDSELRRAVELSVSLWRQAGLLGPQTVPQLVAAENFAWPESPAAVVWLAGEIVPPTPSRRDQALVVVDREAAPHAGAIRFDGTEAESLFATRLWHALTRLPGAQPLAEADVVPLPTVASQPATLDGAIVKPREVSALSTWLVLLLAALFVGERLLSLRVTRR